MAAHIFVFAVRCEAGHDLSADEFSSGRWKAYPVPCSERFARARLHHPGCGAGLLLGNETREEVGAP